MSDTKTVSSAAAALQSLALLATGRTGADVERLVREARQKARRDSRTLTWADIEQALGADRMSMSDDLRWRVSVHEAGHAVAWSLLGIGEVESVTIGLGEIGQVKTRRYSHIAQTEEWLMKTMASMLAGRVAERLLIGEVVSGSGGHEDSDLAKATSLAIDAESILGFAEQQPLVYRPTRGRPDILTLDRDLAERVNTRLLVAEALARELLDSNGPNLMLLAQRLNRVSVMSGDEVRQLLGVGGDGIGDECGETRL
ncbi:ATP-dependent Zn protease [Hoeflea sp. Naph1]|uniref:ATP-dependent Zn protease n=1 Tax=Hoeflea sp. Naph1 TaxID=3388653 RepID=UPI0039900BFE